MKRRLLIAFGILTLMFSFIAVAQTQEEVVSLFEKQVEKFEKFFSSKPKLLFKMPHSTGYIFNYDRFDDYKISYDVRKTDSLVSPFAGYITLNYLMASSDECGDIVVGNSEKRFTTLGRARQKRDDESCYRTFRTSGGKEVKWSAKFIFAFQKKQWVYKDVVDEKNRPDFAFYNAFGNPLRGSECYVEDNDFWKKLIQ